MYKNAYCCVFFFLLYRPLLSSTLITIFYGQFFFPYLHIKWREKIFCCCILVQPNQTYVIYSYNNINNNNNRINSQGRLSLSVRAFNFIMCVCVCVCARLLLFFFFSFVPFIHSLSLIKLWSLFIAPVYYLLKKIEIIESKVCGSIQYSAVYIDQSQTLCMTYCCDIFFCFVLLYFATALCFYVMALQPAH